MIDHNLTQQLIAELREARNQLEQAENILRQHLYDARLNNSQQQAWLAWHKCQEAETNLHNVAVALEKGAGKQ